VKTLIDSIACGVTLTETGLQITLHRRAFAIFGSYVLLLCGVVPSILGLALLDIPMTSIGLLSMSGLPFIILAMVYLRILRRQWGQVTVSAEGIVWRQGERELGAWTLDAALGLHTGIAIHHSMRVRFQAEQILSVCLTDGTKIRVAIGFKDELDAVRSALQDLGVPA
jgi:hypothetical protein